MSAIFLSVQSIGSHACAILAAKVSIVANRITSAFKRAMKILKNTFEFTTGYWVQKEAIERIAMEEARSHLLGSAGLLEIKGLDTELSKELFLRQKVAMQERREVRDPTQKFLESQQLLKAALHQIALLENKIEKDQREKERLNKKHLSTDSKVAAFALACIGASLGALAIAAVYVSYFHTPKI